MNIFDELEAQYNEIDNQYSQKEFNAGRRKWVKKEKEFQRKREINDQAYFVFMFSRLEDKVRVESSKLIKNKQASISSWKQKTPWDFLPNKPEDKLDFKKRLALLTEKGANDFNLVLNYYKERNSITHGGSFTKKINMPSVISDFKRLYKLLKV